jgi:hypothetical protein
VLHSDPNVPRTGTDWKEVSYAALGVFYNSPIISFNVAEIIEVAMCVSHDARK